MPDAATGSALSGAASGAAAGVVAGGADGAVAMAGPSLRTLEQLEAGLLGLPQIAEQVKHHFGPGVYIREAFFPAGSIVLGHCHKTACFNILMQGRLGVLLNGKLLQIAAPFIALGEPWTRKLAYVFEDVIWLNVHPTDKEDVDEIEADVIEKSATWLAHHGQLEEAEQLKALMAQVEELV